MDIFLLFPIHLFSNIDQLKNKKVYLIEEPRFFVDFKYHKLKLAYHRATMKSYFDYLKEKLIDIEYIDFNSSKDSKSHDALKKESNKNIINLYKKLSKKSASTNSSKNIFTYNLGDNVLENKLKTYMLYRNIKFFSK